MEQHSDTEEVSMSVSMQVCEDDGWMDGWMDGWIDIPKAKFQCYSSYHINDKNNTPQKTTHIAYKNTQNEVCVCVCV